MQQPDKNTPRDLFEGNVTYEIPPFQRPYVWNEEDQWQPLFDDVADVAEDVLDGDKVATHFLGAVVLQQQPQGERFTDPTRYSVIDGQQRLTTLQVLLDATQDVLEESGDELAAFAQTFVLNTAAGVEGTPKRFKLWPARADRPAFEAVMDNTMAVSAELAEARVVLAHQFFCKATNEWAAKDGDEMTHRRLGAFLETVVSRLIVVTIRLEENDNDQLIFETLNDRGTPLLQADLIKNFVLGRVEELNGPVEAWNDKYWGDFDDDKWRRTVSQGRNFRSRIDLFLQYWLTAQKRTDIKVDKVFSVFREYAKTRMADLAAAEEFLSRLRADADTFDHFTEADADSTIGRFYRRVVEVFGQGAFIPLLLWIAAADNDIDEQQAQKALDAIESWVVRRTLLRHTFKGVNQIVVSLLKHLAADPDETIEVSDEVSDAVDEEPPDLSAVGDRVVAWLATQTAEARLWPEDDALRATLPGLRLYGMVRWERLAAILASIEVAIRTSKHDPSPVPPRLTIEHVMPQEWLEHWDPGGVVAGNPEARSLRNKRTHTIGNLTLINSALNSSLSNRSWQDHPDQVRGGDVGKGKRSLLQKYALLTLTAEIVVHDDWTDDLIDKRGALLTDRIIGLWPRAASDLATTTPA